VFGLDTLLKGIGDGREKPQFPTKGVVWPAFVMDVCGLGSLNAVEQSKGAAFWRKLSGCSLPSADTMGYVYQRIACDDLRRAIVRLYKRLSRMKALGRVAGFKAVTLDGHELTKSYSRCCDGCSVRNVRVGDEYKPQYYHRVVMLQLLGPQFQLLLDFELQSRGEDEVAAALRLILRVVGRIPRAFSVVLLDGLYARAPVVEVLRRHSKHIIVVVKDENRELLRDARGLFQMQSPKTSTEGKTVYRQWDIEGLTSWEQLGFPIRVVRSLETTTRRKRVGRKWRTENESHDWIWATTLSKREASTETIVFLGHARWRIENQGFNELRKFWRLNHIPKHHQNAILGFLLTLALAFDLFHAFWARNLKPQFQQRHTKIFWACLIAASWWNLVTPDLCGVPP
jgi:hypothetical protein